MVRLVSAFIIGLLLVSRSATAQNTKPFTSEELASRTVYRRAVDAVIWGAPAVTLDMMRQAYFRDAKASYNDIVWWPKGAGWKNQSLDVDTSVRYLFIFCNTKDDGPIVLDLPAAIDSAKFLGTILDTWQVPLTDVGVGGKGGKYLILPPDYKGDVPTGYIPLRPKTYNTYTLLRSILASRSEEDVRKGDALVKQIKVYPLSKAGNPPEPRFVDMTDKLYNAVVPYDDSFYVSLARVINEEPVQSRDLEMLGMLLPLGIEKGKEFKPDPATRTQLKAAAAEAQAWLIEGIISTFERYWPGRKMERPRSANRCKDRIPLGAPQLLRRGCARDYPCQLLRASCKARRGQLLPQHLLRQEWWTVDGREYLSAACPRECSCERVLGSDRV